MPLAVGLSLGTGEPAVCFVGDGGSLFSVHAIWTAAAMKIPVVFVCFVNHEYRLLKDLWVSFTGGTFDSTRFVGLDFNDPALTSTPSCAASAPSPSTPARTTRSPPPWPRHESGPDRPSCSSNVAPDRASTTSEPAMTHHRGSIPAAGVEPANVSSTAPQTTGRSYTNLSEPLHRMRHDDDVIVPIRDGARLLADIHRPDDDGRFPVLVSASPYPRQLQDIGAPMGFIEAGASDFFVPHGYVHVIANLRGTGGSTARSASSTARNASTCTTSSNGPPPSRGATATSGWSASATSP